MGWGVVQGMVALAAMTRSVEAVIGDSTNVAFRLAGLAGRQGRASVMVTSGVRRLVEAHFRWGEGEQVELKGRSGTEMVFPAISRIPQRTDDFADPEGNRDPTAEIPSLNRLSRSASLEGSTMDLGTLGPAQPERYRPAHPPTPRRRRQARTVGA